LGVRITAFSRTALLSTELPLSIAGAAAKTKIASLRTENDFMASPRMVVADDCRVVDKACPVLPGPMNILVAHGMEE
jgi:hypothetical protein